MPVIHSYVCVYVCICIYTYTFYYLCSYLLSLILSIYPFYYVCVYLHTRKPHAPMAFCAETCSFQISIVQEASGGGKKKIWPPHQIFFVFFGAPPPPGPAGRHSWSHTLRPCPLSSTPRTSCESLVHLDLCSISQTNLKSFQTGKRRNFK